MRRSIQERAPIVSQMQEGERAPSFVFALGGMDPASFDVAWHWPLHQFLVWVELNNYSIKDQAMRTDMAKARAGSNSHTL